MADGETDLAGALSCFGFFDSLLLRGWPLGMVLSFD